MGAGASLTDILPSDSLNLDAENLSKKFFCHCCRSIFEIPITSVLINSEYFYFLVYIK